MHARASAVIVLHVGVNRHDENLPFDVCIRKKNILPEASHDIKEGARAREKNFHKYKKGNLGTPCSSARVIIDY